MGTLIRIREQAGEDTNPRLPLPEPSAAAAAAGDATCLGLIHVCVCKLHGGDDQHAYIEYVYRYTCNCAWNAHSHSSEEPNISGLTLGGAGAMVAHRERGEGAREGKADAARRMDGGEKAGGGAAARLRPSARPSVASADRRTPKLPPLLVCFSVKGFHFYLNNYFVLWKGTSQNRCYQQMMTLK